MLSQGLETLRNLLWPAARRPFKAIGAAFAAGQLGLALAGSRIQQRIEARVRDAFLILVFAAAALALAGAAGVFLLMAAWGCLAGYLGPNGASLALGLTLLVASAAPLALALHRARPRRRARG